MVWQTRIPRSAIGWSSTPYCMYTSTFTFAKGDFNDAFFALDAEIAQIAQSIPGYLGEEAWENTVSGLVSNVYYWETMEALQTLVTHPAHIAAKVRQAQWLQGYQVVIAQVLRSYGDGHIAHPLAPSAAAPDAGKPLAT
jgi:heme-degrading monooxygenase HmoA